MSEPIAPSAPATGESDMSTAETLTGIFFEPSRTFEALRVRPRFLVAGLILLALACIVTVVLYTRVDMGQLIRERMERSPNAAQQTEQQKEMGARIGKTFGMFVVPASVPIAIAAGSALYLLGVLVFGGSITYKKSLSVWTYSWLPPSILGALLAIIILFVKDPESIDPEKMVATNPGALFGPDSPRVLVALLSQFDLLRFFGLYLAALGLRKVAKLSSGQAWGVVLSLWFLGLLFSVAAAGIFGS